MFNKSQTHCPRNPKISPQFAYRFTRISHLGEPSCSYCEEIDFQSLCTCYAIQPLLSHSKIFTMGNFSPCLSVLFFVGYRRTSLWYQFCVRTCTCMRVTNMLLQYIAKKRRFCLNTVSFSDHSNFLVYCCTPQRVAPLQQI